jgi:hypothetical protein
MAMGMDANGRGDGGWVGAAEGSEAVLVLVVLSVSVSVSVWTCSLQAGVDAGQADCGRAWKAVRVDGDWVGGVCIGTVVVNVIDRVPVYAYGCVCVLTGLPACRLPACPAWW